MFASGPYQGPRLFHVEKVELLFLGRGTKVPFYACAKEVGKRLEHGYSAKMPRRSGHAQDLGWIPAAHATAPPVNQRSWTTKSLDEHVGLIARQVNRSLHDGETRRLAVKIVSGTFDNTRDRNGNVVSTVSAYGRNFLAPPGPVCKSRDEECEIEKIWDFVVLNIRYVYDPADIDTFPTLKETLLMGGEDCDGLAVAFAALLKTIGFTVSGRVISVKEQPDQPVHIYPMVGLPKDNPRRWMPLDATVEGATPGWQYPGIAQVKDYLL